MLIRQLPLDSRTHAQSLDRWSVTNYQLAALIDQGNARRLEAARLAGAKGVPKSVTPTWRPGDAVPNRPLTKAEALAILPGMKTTT